MINLSNTSLNKTTNLENFNKLDENLSNKLMDIKASVENAYFVKKNLEKEKSLYK